MSATVHLRRPAEQPVAAPAVPTRVVVLWRSYLPYGVDRLRNLTRREVALGLEAYGLEVTATDPEYAFLSRAREPSLRLETCFADARLEDLTATEVRAALWSAFTRLDPDAIFAPATPFVEGMAAITWARRHRRRVFLMDDAWEATDARGPFVTTVKRLIHGCVDGALVPHVAYRSYWHRLGVPGDRVVPGVDVVDNDRFRRPDAPAAGARELLFVGRDLPRKGLDTLLAAYRAYRERCTDGPWGLTVVGPVVPRPAPGVRYAGALTGSALLAEYWRASVLIVPSDYEQWGLVVNEAMAASLPVLATTTVGAARALIEDGVTGWLTAPGDAVALSQRLQGIAALPASVRLRIGHAACVAIERQCPLDAFGDGVVRALALPPRGPAAVASRAAARLWRGRTRLAS
jgi:glycosyltransferase involved in cell wall biosynthesis